MTQPAINTEAFEAEINKKPDSAEAWAKYLAAHLHLYQGPPHNEVVEVLIGWFANAIERSYDHRTRAPDENGYPVPEGMALVPREATEAMADAATAACYSADHAVLQNLRPVFQRAYKAMIAAAEEG